MKVQLALFWQIGNILSQAVFQLIFIAVSSRLLPKEVHGAFALINAIVFLARLFSEGGVGSALVQRKLINEKHISMAFYFSLIISLCLFCFLFLISNFIEVFYNSKIQSIHIQVASFSFIAMSLGKISSALLIKEFRFKEIFMSNVIGYIIGYIICGLLLAYNGFGIWSFIVALIVCQTIRSIINYSYVQHSLSFNYGTEECKQIFYFGSSFTLVRIAAYLSSQIDKVMIGKLFDIGGLGIFEKSQFISKMPSKYLGSTINSILFSYFSKLIEQSNKEKYFNIIFGIILNIGVYSAILTYYNSDLLVHILLGIDWIEAIPILQIFSLSIPFVLVAILGDIVVRAENKIFYSLPIKIVYVFLMAFSVYFSYQSGLTRVTLNIVASIVIHAFLMISMIIWVFKYSLTQFLQKNIYAVLCGILLVIKYQIIVFILSDFNCGVVTTLLVQILLDLPLLYIFYRYFLPQAVIYFGINLFKPIFTKFSK